MPRSNPTRPVKYMIDLTMPGDQLALFTEDQAGGKVQHITESVPIGNGGSGFRASIMLPIGLLALLGGTFALPAFLDYSGTSGSSGTDSAWVENSPGFGSGDDGAGDDPDIAPPHIDDLIVFYNNKSLDPIGGQLTTDSGDKLAFVYTDERSPKPNEGALGFIAQELKDGTLMGKRHYSDREKFWLLEAFVRGNPDRYAAPNSWELSVEPDLFAGMKYRGIQPGKVDANEVVYAAKLDGSNVRPGFENLSLNQRNLELALR